MIPDSDEEKLVKAVLTVKFDYLEIRTHKGEPLKKFNYTEISSADYSFSQHPRWKTAVFLSPWALLSKGKKHWYTIHAGEDFAILRLDKNNYRQVTAAVENKIKTRRPSHVAVSQAGIDPESADRRQSTQPRQVYVDAESRGRTVGEATVAVADLPETASASGGRTFRDTRWGMSKEEVLVAEGKDRHLSGPNHFRYYRNVLGMDVSVAYYFEEDYLVKARYVFEEAYEDPSKYIDDFQTVKGKLTEKYGTPAEDTLAWRDESLNPDASKLGQALKLGQVTLVSRWTSPESKIVSNLFAMADGDIRLIVEYSELKQVKEAF